MALVAVGLSVCSALTVTDEVQHHLHLLGEAQRLDFNDLRLAMRRALLGFDGNEEIHLESQKRVYGFNKT